MPSVRLTIALPDHMLRAIDLAAAEHDTSRSEIVRGLIREWIAENGNLTIGRISRIIDADDNMRDLV